MPTDFKLHQLGWKNFQHLCGTILRESLGQDYQEFADTDDGGRDGAFRGSWKASGGERLSGTFTFQCKHSSRHDRGISMSSLAGELEKAGALARRGLADVYVLMTNMTVTATKEAEIRTAFESVRGLKSFRLYGRDWIEAQIKENKRIRRLVPRLYGLGDLTEILDERAYEQAQSILDHLGPDFSKFVTTDALTRAAIALEEKSFVLLLGEPCCGKSTIASALALGAADEWGCRPVFVDSPRAFRDTWNPNDRHQFFWIDDAFGSTQYERERALEWNRCLPLLHAAVNNGAKFVFTSRDYIYNAALHDLKGQSFTLIRDSQVVIKVEELTLEEREQILYNHIKLGKQPLSIRTKLKSHLPEIARHPKFLPETARRLGDPFFTKSMDFRRESLVEMVGNMREILFDTLRQLGDANTAAIALVFMRSGRMPCDLQLAPSEERALQLIGADLGSVRKALNAMDSSLVTKIPNNGAPYWQFKHPSIRDAFGSLIAGDPSLTEIYLRFTPIQSLLREITCGASSIENVKLEVPEPSFPLIDERLMELDEDDPNAKSLLISFLRNRCNKEFLSLFLARRRDFISSLKYGSWMTYCQELKLAAYMHSLGLLPESERSRAAREITRLSLRHADAAAFFEPNVEQLLSESEKSVLLKNLKRCVAGSLRREITSISNYCKKSKTDPWSSFYYCQQNLKTFKKIFSSAKLQRSFRLAGNRMLRISAKLAPVSKAKQASSDTKRQRTASGSRSVFDDVDK